MADGRRAEFLNWAHQGGAREGPSNTIWAMDEALAKGANALEFDVHLSKDGAPGGVVVIHDDSLGRTTDGWGKVRCHEVADLQKLDAAHWWVPGSVDDHDAPPDAYTLRGQVTDEPRLRIPRADEVLDRYPDVPMTIEVKSKEAAGPLIQLLRDHGRRDDVIVTSFKDGIVRELRRSDVPVSPGLVHILWFLVRVKLGIPPRRSRYVCLQVPPKKYGIVVVDERFVEACHRAGLAVDVWTIDHPGEMHRLLDLGVDGIMTDSPSVLAGVLAERGG